MLVLQSTDLGKMWHKWVMSTLELYGQSWVHNVPKTLFGQQSPADWKEHQKTLQTKVRLFELVDATSIAINPSTNGNHLNAIFNDTIVKYWEQSDRANKVAEIDFAIFMACLEEGSITLAEQRLEPVT